MVRLVILAAVVFGAVTVPAVAIPYQAAVACSRAYWIAARRDSTACRGWNDAVRSSRCRRFSTLHPADRCHRRSTEVAGSHASLVVHAKEVAAVIEQAALEE